MIELHTRMFCQCGLRYYHMMAGDVPLSGRLEVVSTCPVEAGGCGRENRAEYEFSADFHCQKDGLMVRLFGKRKPHYIADHFSKNEGSMQEEIYPRRCVCGSEILLKQRRVK